MEIKITNELIIKNISLVERFKTKENLFYPLCTKFTEKYLQKIKDTYPFFRLYKNIGFGYQSLEEYFYGGSIEIYEYPDDYFIVIVRYNAQLFNTYKLDQLSELMLFLKVLLNNNINESRFEKYKKGKEDIRLYNIVNKNYFLNRNRLKKYETISDNMETFLPFSKNEIDKIRKIVNISDKCNYSKRPFIIFEILSNNEKFSHNFFLKIYKSDDDYYFVNIGITEEYNLNYHFFTTYKCDQLKELIIILKILFDDNINESVQNIKKIEYFDKIIDDILNIKTITLKVKDEVDTIEFSIDEINKIKKFINTDLFIYWREVYGDLTFSIYFNIDNQTTKKVDYQFADYKIYGEIFKLKDDYYQLNFSFYKKGKDPFYHIYKNGNLNESLYIKYFDQLSDLKKYLNRLSLIIS